MPKPSKIARMRLDRGESGRRKQEAMHNKEVKAQQWNDTLAAWESHCESIFNPKGRVRTYEETSLMLLALKAKLREEKPLKRELFWNPRYARVNKREYYIIVQDPGTASWLNFNLLHECTTPTSNYSRHIRNKRSKESSNSVWFSKKYSQLNDWLY